MIMQIWKNRQELTANQEAALVDWHRKYDEVSAAIRCGVDKLPQNLRDRWYEPAFIIVGSDWVEKASQHIPIPHPEIWNDSRSEKQIVDAILD